ncbi:MAG TPA: hypothetical protein VL096_07075 [Pirellulaceae bacterium]|nr:hypothetical protein [Pirellulaceae bacterium]
MVRLLALVTLCLFAPSLLQADEGTEKLATALRKAPTNVYPQEQQEAARAALGKELRAAIVACNVANTAAWEAITTREQWEAFRVARLDALKASLGWPKSRPTTTAIHITGEHARDGYVVRNLLYETRPHFYVSANLYLPAKLPASLPGVLLSHSHHSPKTQGELQDMGATWARAGCAVLVPDHLGHGERRQHPFASAGDFDGEFAVGRQDYYFRYDTGMQLHLAGQSLMSWLVWDLLAGVDVLLKQERIDPERIILLGGVAGGGDPAAVAGAVDERIACVGPFNFGGPQPETRYPLPDDAATWFNYAGSGGWESTRNLSCSAQGLGFQPWAIVGSIAPRRLIYGHEFAWDGERDPVWKRLEKIWGFYGESARLAVAHGQGNLRGKEPEASHCGNIGALHRRMIHPVLEKWFAISATSQTEFSSRLSAAELNCWNDQWREKLQPERVHEVLLREHRKTDKLRERKAWVVNSGFVAPPVDAKVAVDQRLESAVGNVTMTRARVNGRVPLVLLLPDQVGDVKPPVVLGVSESGKAVFLRERAVEIAELLGRGVAVCLIDVSGTGELASGQERGQYSEATSESSSALMLGQPLLGRQLLDLQTALDYLEREAPVRSRPAIWGESFAQPLASAAKFNYPRRIERPGEASPLGLLLPLLRETYYHGGTCCLYARGGLVSNASLLESPFVQVPHGLVVPGALGGVQISAMVAACCPLPIRLDGCVDGTNRLVSSGRLAKEFGLAQAKYEQGQAANDLELSATAGSPVEFFIRNLRE